MTAPSNYDELVGRLIRRANRVPSDAETALVSEAAAAISALEGENAQERSANQHWIIRMTDIREASGVGYKPVLNEVPDAIRAARQSAEAKLEAVNAAHRRGLIAGMAVAAGLVAEWDDTLAAEILDAAGTTTAAELRAAGVDDYDIERLAAVLDAIAATDSRTP